MSNHQDNKSGKKEPKVKSWAHLREEPKPVKGPQKPWDPEAESAADEFLAFLKDSENKKVLQDFVIDAFKKFEAKNKEKFLHKLEHEERVNSNRMAPHHEPGNIAPAMSEDFNMHDVETIFGRGLRGTKANLVRSLEERVDEINRLLADIGGFSAQIKSSFARSTVVFLQQEDPKYDYRERLIFSINLPNYELKRAWIHGKKEKEADGRTSLQATWDEAINALARTVEAAGLKPKYCKNDRHYGRFVMKQDLKSIANLPDEYFSFTLDYNTEEKIKEMCVPYDRIVKDYETKIARLESKLKHYPEDSPSLRYVMLRKKYLALVQERDFFVGTTPDPNQLDEGLLFLIEVSTLKDYQVVKDRMQSIMTRYILYLSKIAAKDAEIDPELEYQMWKGKAKGNSHVPQGQRAEEDQGEPISVAELEDIPQYTIDTSLLKRVPPKPKAGSPNPAQKKKKIA